MAKVSVERAIEQVQDGTQYKGHLKIGEARFDYELVFAVPIPQLDDAEPVDDKSEIRRRFQVSIKRDNAEVDLTDDEYGFFFQMLVMFAVEFYNEPQTRDSNNGVLGRSKGVLSGLGVKSSIGLTSSGSCDFPPDLIAMLNSPKFGCGLAA